MLARADRQIEIESAGTPPDNAGRPVFSIVTPSLNQGRYLGDALASVRHQCRARVEHIVVDGGSADDTEEILRAAPGAVRYVIESDEGQSDALNKGLQLARGRIIGWLNADDFYLPGAFDAVERFFACNPRVHVVYGDAVFVDERGRVVRGLQEHGFDASMLLYHGCYIPSTATFFRSRLRDWGLLRLDPTLHLTMDQELFLRLDAAGVQFGYLPRDLAAFRWHESNKSWDAPARDAEHLRVQRMHGTTGKGDFTLAILRRVYKAKHGVMKLCSGAYGRQLRWRVARGATLRWWPQP